MPCYNAAATLTRAVNSIKEQTLRDWELIICDDGSNDGSPEIAKNLADKDQRIKLFNRPHRGVVATSNFGFKQARAKIVARMDADDVSRPHRLAKQLHWLTKEPSLQAVTCLAHFAGHKKTAEGYARHVQWTNTHLTPEQIACARFIDLPFPHPTLMYHRELVEKYGGYREGDFPEDYEMILRWIDQGVRIGKMNDILYDWHDSPTRLSRADSRYDMNAFHRCKAKYLKNAITRSKTSNRHLWIWGAGRQARKCAHPLESTWKPASGYIDIDPRKIGQQIHGKPVISPHHLPPQQESVIISYVGTRGAREQIRTFLLAAGRIEGHDFWLAC